MLLYLDERIKEILKYALESNKASEISFTPIRQYHSKCRILLASNITNSGIIKKLLKFFRSQGQLPNSNN